MSLVRILVVNDYAPFRKVVRSILEEKPGLQVIGEASNGLTAVQKAKEFQPDLVLLDIDLPELNGLEVAEQILKISPKPKILLLSQHSSPILVREALSTGAHGYVVKWEAARELAVAVRVVLSNKPFISASLSQVQPDRA